MSKTNL